MKSPPKKNTRNSPKKIIDPTITVAVITGVVTIVGALLASPVLLALINKTPTPVPPLQTAQLAAKAIESSTNIPPTEPPTATIEPTQTKAAGPCTYEDMVLIPEGVFLMGASDSDLMAEADEKPQKEIYLSAYCIDKYEVSNTKYAKTVSEHIFASREDNLPVTQVSWFDAKDYCTKLGLDLPTEAQWEKAARGTGGWIYPWGNKWKVERANSFYIEPHRLMAVTDFSNGISPYGIFNMAGNVSEWVDDWYDPDWYKIMELENPHKTLEPVDNDPARVVRGGDFRKYEAELRTTNREGISPPDDKFSFVGFRCAAKPINP